LKASDRRLSETPSHTFSRRFGIQVSKSSKFYRKGIIHKKGREKRPQRDIQDPLGAFILDPSGKSTS
jgi:hypothetical protein